ncbi:MAG: hypothetical protein SGI74_10445, partial [Oligoflexia bacterium]|nr:hypothetical protein [Oligoflexia bacterium]
LESKKLEIDKQVSMAIKMCQELDPAAAQMVRDQINQLAKEKSELDLALVRLENDIWEQKESDEGVLEFCGTIEEIQRGYKKATPAVKKRMIKRAFSSIKASASILKLYYRMTKSQEAEGSSENKKRAEDFKSSAQVFHFECPPTNDLGDQRVVGSSIVKIGRRDRI